MALMVYIVKLVSASPYYLLPMKNTTQHKTYRKAAASFAMVWAYMYRAYTRHGLRKTYDAGYTFVIRITEGMAFWV